MCGQFSALLSQVNWTHFVIFCSLYLKFTSDGYYGVISIICFQDTCKEVLYPVYDFFCSACSHFTSLFLGYSALHSCITALYKNFICTFML